jgi:hypothetical protein
MSMIVNKITLNKWLNTKNKYTNTKIIDLIHILSEYLYNYIKDNNELELQTDKNTFYKYFLNFIYQEYVYPIKKIEYICIDKIFNEEYLDSELFLLEYFEYKFSEEIIDLYLHFKYLTNNYNFNLFNHKNDTSYPLLLFIFYNSDIKDPYIDEKIYLEEIMIYE